MQAHWFEIAELNPATSYLPLTGAFLVIEVADTTLARDRDVKAPEYAKAGLAELWIVHVEAQETLVLRAPGLRLCMGELVG